MQEIQARAFPTADCLFSIWPLARTFSPPWDLLSKWVMVRKFLLMFNQYLSTIWSSLEYFFALLKLIVLSLSLIITLSLSEHYHISLILLWMSSTFSHKTMNFYLFMSFRVCLSHLDSRRITQRSWYNQQDGEFSKQYNTTRGVFQTGDHLCYYPSNLFQFTCILQCSTQNWTQCSW